MKSWKTAIGLAGGLFLFGGSGFAKCPVMGSPEVLVRAPVGNLTIDTTGTDSVEVDGASALSGLQEVCDIRMIQIEWQAGKAGSADWRIRVPKSVNLDLTSQGGNLTVGDLDGTVTLRTGGGKVTTGNIKGNTAIVTQAGAIMTGNIGGRVELRSEGGGGKLTVGNVAGEAELVTKFGEIRAGIVQGRVTARTGSDHIIIKEARGDIIAETKAGNIIIGDAGRMVQANTGGGDIENERVRGGFKGFTESGNVTINNASSWVEVKSGSGDIYVKLASNRTGNDLHVSLTTAVGNVTLSVPADMKGALEAVVDQQPRNGTQQISTYFPLKNSLLDRGISNQPSKVMTNFPGGVGSPVMLHTSLGKINILKWELR